MIVAFNIPRFKYISIVLILKTNYSDPNRQTKEDRELKKSASICPVNLLTV